MRTRHHGDLSLETVLHTGADFVITDFDGDRSRPLPERRRKRSPLRDVAGMVTSFHRAAMSTWLDPSVVRPEDRPRLGAWVEHWHAWASATFLGAYLDASADAGFLPATSDELAMLLHRLILETALVDLERELAARSDAVRIPLDFIVDMLRRER